MKNAITTKKAPSASAGWRWNGRTRSARERFHVHSDADAIVRIVGLRAQDLGAVGVEVLLVPTPVEGTFDVYVPIKGA